MRIVGRIVLGLAALAAAAAVPTSAALAAPQSSLESSLLVDINAFRAQHGLARLRVNPQLTAAARAHTQQMAQDGYFAHESADGSTFMTRLESYYPVAPWHSWTVGENLLWSASDLDGAQALDGWLASPPHRRNLMDPRWREIGISAVQEAQAPGIYQGQDVTIVTTDFGVRR